MSKRIDIRRDPAYDLKRASYGGAVAEINISTQTSLIDKRVALAKKQIAGAIEIFKDAISGISEVESLIPANSPIGKGLASQLGIELGEAAGDTVSVMIKGAL